MWRWLLTKPSRCTLHPEKLEISLISRADGLCLECFHLKVIPIWNPVQEKPIRLIDEALTLVGNGSVSDFPLWGKELGPIFSALTAARCLSLWEQSSYSSAYRMGKLNEDLFQTVTDICSQFAVIFSFLPTKYRDIWICSAPSCENSYLIKMMSYRWHFGNPRLTRDFSDVLQSRTVQGRMISCIVGIVVADVSCATRTTGTTEEPAASSGDELISPARSTHSVCVITARCQRFRNEQGKIRQCAV